MVYTLAKSGQKGKLNCGFSAHLPQCVLRGHLFYPYKATLGFPCPLKWLIWPLFMRHKATFREAPVATVREALLAILLWLIRPLFSHKRPPLSFERLLIATLRNAHYALQAIL